MFNLLKKLFQHKRKCSCILNDLTGISGFGLSRDANCLLHGDAAMMNSGHCPDCHGTSFHLGPEGGVAKIIRCTDCGAEFTVEVTNPDSDPAQIIYWGRVGA